MSDSLSFYIGRRYFSASQGGRLASFISTLAIVGLILGVALMIVVLSIMNGFDLEMRTRILGVVPHIRLEQQGGLENWRELAGELAGDPRIVSVAPVSEFDGLVNFRGLVQPARLEGLALEDAEFRLPVLQVVPPEMIDDLRRCESGVLVAFGLAKKLGLEKGDRLSFIVPARGERTGVPAVATFQVAGIFRTHTELDQSLALTGFDTLAGLSGNPGRIEGIQLQIVDVFAARAIAYDLLPRLPPGFRFSDWMRNYGNLYQAIRVSKNLVALLVVLIMAIAAFNVISMLVMSVNQKRSGIAILKTLGMTNPEILRIFLVQGMLIGLGGCLTGALLGALAAEQIPQIARWLEHLLGMQFLNTEVYPIDYLPAELRWPDVFRVTMIALLLTFCSTLYPALRASRVRPAEELRYE